MMHVEKDHKVCRRSNTIRRSAEHETACGQNSGEPRENPGRRRCTGRDDPAVISQAKGQSRAVIVTNNRRLCFILLSRRFYCVGMEAGPALRKGAHGMMKYIMGGGRFAREAARTG